MIFLPLHHKLLCIFHVTATQDIFCAAVFNSRTVDIFSRKDVEMLVQ